MQLCVPANGVSRLFKQHKGTAILQWTLPVAAGSLWQMQYSTFGRRGSIHSHSNSVGVGPGSVVITYVQKSTTKQTASA